MSKQPAKRNPQGLVLTGKPSETEEQMKSRAALTPSVNGASVIQAYQTNVMGDTDLIALADGLRDTFKEVSSGDLSTVEAMLISQATALQTMFTSLARRASHQEQLKHYGVFMGLALKAQAQSRATISALVDLKYPKQATFVKQANIAHGPQQVNNGAGPGEGFRTSAHTHTRTRKKQNPSTPNYWSTIMANGWTPERRARQAELIRSWKPWEKSTGPKTPDGKAKAARNGDPGGVLAEARADVRNLRQWANELLREHRELMKLVKP